MEQNNFYSILQIDPAATQEEVRVAYRRLALIHHPDRSDHPHANQFMQQINEAYDVLSNQEKRLRYDQDRLTPVVQEPIQTPAPERHKARVYREHRKDVERKRKVWISKKLKHLSHLVLLLMVLFFWSLATGGVNIILVLGFVLLSVYLIASIILKLKSFPDQGPK